MVLQAPSAVQSGATVSTGQDGFLQGYMLDNAAANRAAPAARVRVSHACVYVKVPVQFWYCQVKSESHKVSQMFLSDEKGCWLCVRWHIGSFGRESKGCVDMPVS